MDSWITSGVPEAEWISGGPAPALKYRLTRNQKVEVDKIDLPSDAITISSLNLDWICNSNGFLSMILDPLTDINPGYRVQHYPGTVIPSRLIEIDQEYQRFKPASLPGYMAMLPLNGKGGNMKFRFFAGPFDTAILKKIDEKYSDAQPVIIPIISLVRQCMAGSLLFLNHFLNFYLFL